MPQTGCTCTHTYVHTYVVDQPALWLSHSRCSLLLGYPVNFLPVQQVERAYGCAHTNTSILIHTHVHIYTHVFVSRAQTLILTTFFGCGRHFFVSALSLRFLFCGFIFQLAALFDRVKRNGSKIKWREMEFELFYTIETVVFVSLYSSLLLFFVHLLYSFYLPHVLFLCAQPFYAFVPRLSCWAPSWRTICLHRV